MRYIQILPILVIISACGQDIGREVTPEAVRAEISEQPINEPVIVENKPVMPPLAEAPVPTPTPVPETDTGSTSFQFAQLAPRHPKYANQNYWTPPPVITNIYGTDTKQEQRITLDEPPKELSPCYTAALLGLKFPLMDEKYRYNSWWLLASSTSVYNWSETKQVYFYWARESAKDEIGISPIKHITIPLADMPEDTKINTGFTTLPYQWISRIDHYSVLPQHPEEPC